MSRAQIVLTNEERRVEAAKWITAAPPGTRVEFKAPKRSLPQNDRMWAMLSDISTQLRWHGQHLTANDWKLVFLDALDKETRTCPDIYGIGRVNLGRSSSDLSKEEMSQLMELVVAFGTEHSVKFHDDPADHIAPKANKKTADKLVNGVVSDTAPATKLTHKPPATTEGYIAYARAEIKSGKDENWFLSQEQARLRQYCKVGELATKLLHSLIKETCAKSEMAS